MPPWLSLPPIPLLAVLTEPALSAHQVEQASGEGRKEGQGHLAHSLRTIKTFISFNLIIPPRGIASKEEKNTWTVYSCVICNKEKVEANVMSPNRKMIK